MIQSKFSLADLLTVLAALAFGVVCFLGSNLYTLGETRQSIVFAAIITFLLGGTAFCAKLMKRTNRNFKFCFILEIIFLVLFACFAFFFARSPFPHYFVVAGQKAEIQNKLTMSITQADNMFTEYERYAKNRENLYKSKLRSVAAAKNINPSEYVNYGFENNSVSNETQIENKMFTVHADLFPTNYEETKQIAFTWLDDAKNIVKGWKPIDIVRIVNESEQKSNNWLNELISLSKVREKGEQAEDFVNPLTFEDVKNHFITLSGPTFLSIGLAVFAYMLMLLSYFFTERSTKTIIGKTKGNGDFDVNYNNKHNG